MVASISSASDLFRGRSRLFGEADLWEVQFNVVDELLRLGGDVQLVVREVEVGEGDRRFQVELLRGFFEDEFDFGRCFGGGHLGGRRCCSFAVAAQALGFGQ